MKQKKRKNASGAVGAGGNRPASTGTPRKVWESHYDKGCHLKRRKSQFHATFPTANAEFTQLPKAFPRFFLSSRNGPCFVPRLLEDDSVEYVVVCPDVYAFLLTIRPFRSTSNIKQAVSWQPRRVPDCTLGLVAFINGQEAFPDSRGTHFPFLHFSMINCRK